MGKSAANNEIVQIYYYFSNCAETEDRYSSSSRSRSINLATHL